jgi:hypothetical protein
MYNVNITEIKEKIMKYRAFARKTPHLGSMF